MSCFVADCPSALSRFLVLTQFICIAMIMASGRLWAGGVFGLLQLSGVILGGWSIMVMKPGCFRIVPEVKANGILTIHGPYRLLRHPMYTSLLLLMTPMVWVDPKALRVVLLIILALDLFVKLLYEERILVNHFPGYTDYKRHSWRLIPFIF